MSSLRGLNLQRRVNSRTCKLKEHALEMVDKMVEGVLEMEDKMMI